MRLARTTWLAGTLVALAAAAGELVAPRLLADSPAPYPKEALEQRIGGEIALEITIDEQGEVAESRLVEPGHPSLNRSALEAALSLRFEPAKVDGVPVPVRIRFVYRFEPPPAPEPPDVAVESAGSSQETSAVFAAASTRAELRAGAPSVRAPGVAARETIVRARREMPSPSTVRVARDELRQAPGTLGDPFRVVMLMPGVASVASGISYPVVRGAQPAETGYYIDGVRVPLLYHLFLGPSVVHPDFIEAIELYPGAAPARYGRLLGGVVDAKVAQPRRLQASAYLDVLNVGGFVQAPIERTGTEIGVAGRVSYSPWLLEKVTSRIQGNAQRHLVLDFYDYQARVEQKLPGGKARLFAFGSSDVASTLRDDDTHSILFHRLDLRYRPRIGSGEAEVAATVGLDRLQYVEQAGIFRSSVLELVTHAIAARASYEASYGPVTVSVGGDVDHRTAYRQRWLSFTGVGEASPQFETAPVATGTFVGAHTEVAWRKGPWTVAPGMRVDNYHLVGGTDHLALEPRLWVRRTLSDVVMLKGGAGLFHQPPSTLLHLPVIDVASLPRGLQKAAHFTAGLEWRLPDAFEVDASVYFHPLLRTMEFNPFAGPVLDGFEIQPTVRHRLAPTASREQGGRGLSYGFELMVRRHLSERWFGWVAYSLQRSSRYMRFDQYDETGAFIGEAEGWLPSALDQTHVLNAMVSYRIGETVTVGASVHFHTGRPEIGGLTSETQRIGFDPNGRLSWVPVGRDQADRLPPFFRVDGRVAKEWAIDRFRLEGYLDLFNVSLSREVVAWRYVDAAGTLVKEPEGAVVALPVLGLKGSY